MTSSSLAKIPAVRNGIPTGRHFPNCSRESNLIQQNTWLLFWLTGTLTFSFFSFHPFSPNNQQRGFRETVFLAVKLNRTIVPPGFFKHSRTDKEENSESDAHIIAPWHRFDISALATMMSTADPMKIGNECGGHFQSYFKVKPGYCSGTGLIKRFFFIKGPPNLFFNLTTPRGAIFGAAIFLKLNWPQD